MAGRHVGPACLRDCQPTRSGRILFALVGGRSGRRLRCPSLGHLQQFISELRRRRVIRALIAWGVFCFAVLQVIEPVLHAYHLPEWPLTLVVTALGAGFPVTAILAWVFDITSKGITRTAPASEPGVGGLGLTGPRLALLLVALGLLAAAPGLVYFFVWPGARRPTEVSDSASGALGGPSVAVLPFVNLSSDKEQEYFSDGIAEEILNALAQVDGLRVVGRTSSFAFKGKSEDLAGIAQKLHAASILEGSVRKEGTRVRITAQLINAVDGYHLWSQTFDRELTGVFAVQDEIAKAVARALALKLLPSRAGPADRQATDPEAHRLYLLALQLAPLQTVEADDRAIAALRQAGRIAPADARIQALLANVVWTRAEKDTVDMRAADAEALAMAERAVALGPDIPDAYLVRGFLRHMTTWDWRAARADYERALALAPGDVVARTGYARLLATTGKLPEATETMTRVTEADPLSSDAWLWIGILQAAAGHPELGEVSFGRGLDLTPNNIYLLRELGFALLLQGRAQEALALAARHPVEWMRQLLEAMAEHQLGNDVASRRALEQLARAGTPAAYQIAQVHAWRGEKDLALEWLERGYATNDAGMRYAIYDPMLRPLRSDPRYKALLKKMNLPMD